MLVLSRKIEEVIVLHTSDGPIEVKLVQIDTSRRKCRFGITAPASVVVLRKELGRPIETVGAPR
jgi:carbon storage regulator CsrA